MAPYICHIHNGLYESVEDMEGCQSTYCVSLRELDLPERMNVAGFGGSDKQKISRHDSKQFHKDMYAYKEAHDQGVSPDQVTAKAAESALRIAEDN